MATLPRYPVYVPSRGRYQTCYTARLLDKYGTPFRLVVERPEFDAYAERFGAERLLVLPFVDRGLVAARNWIKDHATAEGHVRHWQLDDNISDFYRRWKGGKRIRCDTSVALRVVEDFADRYTNVAIAGLNYKFNVPEVRHLLPLNINCHVYSCTLVLNALPHRWRLYYNDDVDLCLQVLADGWCTVLFNAFMAHKKRTMTISGGNTPVYQGDGRLKMARSLERMWPGVVSVNRRFKRPQHVVAYNWKRFDTPLQRRLDFDPAQLSSVDDYGLYLEQMAEIRSSRIRAMLEEQQGHVPAHGTDVPET